MPCLSLIIHTIHLIYTHNRRMPRDASLCYVRGLSAIGIVSLTPIYQFRDCGRFVGDGYHWLLPVITCQRTPQLITSVISISYNEGLLSGGSALLPILLVDCATKTTWLLTMLSEGTDKLMAVERQSLGENIQIAVQAPPISAGDHSTRGLALLSLQLERP
jgi:hypothetical protein